VVTGNTSQPVQRNLDRGSGGTVEVVDLAVVVGGRRGGGRGCGRRRVGAKMGVGYIGVM